MAKGWKIKKLGEVCDKGSSNVSQNQLASEEGKYPIYGASGFIKDVSFYHNDKPYLSIVKDGSGVGRITKMEAKTSVIGTLQYIFPKDGIDLHYLYYAMQLIDFKKYVAGAAIPHIYFKDYQNEPFLYVPLEEQHRIVSILDKCFSAIDKAKANAERCLSLSKALFESYLQGVFGSTGSPTEKNGKGWEVKKLGELASFRNGMNFTKSSKGETIKIVGVKDFQDNFWVPFDELESVVIDGKLSELDELKEKDIIAVRSNGNPALIGRTLLAGDVEGKTSHSGFTIRIRLNSNEVLPIYLCRYLKTQKTRKELIEKGNGVGIKSLNQGSLSSLSVPFPKSKTEQQTIVRQLDALQERTQTLVAVYQKKIADLEELRKSILRRAFVGELLTEKYYKLNIKTKR